MATALLSSAGNILRVSNELRFGHFTYTLGAFRIASTAYQYWPTWSRVFLLKPYAQSRRISNGTLSDSQFEKRPSQASRPKILPYIALPGITTLKSGSSYPEGNFRRNQILGGSMSLSPLCPCVTSNLHVSTVRPASITVSHDFTVQGYSSPPFGSNYQCFDSKLNPMDSRSAPVEGSLSPERELDTCTGFAFTTHHRPQMGISFSRFCKPYSFILALTVDSLIRVSRREALIPF